MGSVFFLVGPVRGENLVGLAAEQEVEFLLEDAVDLFAALSSEIGHRPAAELEALGRILGRPAGPLHDAIHGNLGADDDLPHGSLSLLEPRTSGLRLRGGCGHLSRTTTEKGSQFAKSSRGHGAGDVHAPSDGIVAGKSDLRSHAVHWRLLPGSATQRLTGTRAQAPTISGERYGPAPPAHLLHQPLLQRAQVAEVLERNPERFD